MNLKDLGFDFNDMDIPVIFGDEDLDRKYQEYFFNFDDAVLNVPLYFFNKGYDENINQTKKRGFIKLINNAIKTKKPINDDLLNKFFALYEKENVYT